MDKTDVTSGSADILRPVEELEALERYLQRAPILTWGDATGIDGGHPEKHRVLLAGGVHVLAKPGHDQYEPVPRHEAAGWQVAKHLGFLGLVAATVVRDVPRLATHEPIQHSVQVIWPDGRQWLTPLDQFPGEEVWQAAVFDAVVSHLDHGDNNWFGVPDPSSGAVTHLRLVDTGNAFDMGPGAAPNSSFYRHHEGEDLPEDVAGAVRSFADNPPPILASLLGDAEAERVRARANQLADTGVLRIG